MESGRITLFLVGLIASIITIFVFISGIDTLGGVYDKVTKFFSDDNKKEIVNNDNSNNQPTEIEKKDKLLSSQKNTSSNQKVFDKPKIILENGFPFTTKFDLYIKTGNTKKLILNDYGPCKEAKISADDKKIVATTDGSIYICDIDGKNMQKYCLFWANDCIYRKITNLTFVSNRSFRIYIALDHYDNDMDITLSNSNFRFQGLGIYEFTIGELNYISNMRKL